MFQSSHTRDCKSCEVHQACSFKKLPEALLDRISESKRTQQFARGETIFGIGDDANHFYCVRKGTLQIYRSSQYREHSFQIADSGDWIGYRDALAGGEYQHGARCLSEPSVCRFPRSALEDCLRESPEFSRELMAQMATGWVQSEQQSYNLGSRKLMERVADYLLSLKAANAADARNDLSGVTALASGGEDVSVAPVRSRSGNSSASGISGTISGAETAPPNGDVRITREMLATLLGTTTESVIRTLSDFKSRGWIELDGRKVTLSDEAALERLVADS